MEVGRRDLEKVLGEVPQDLVKVFSNWMLKFLLLDPYRELHISFLKTVMHNEDFWNKIRGKFEEIIYNRLGVDEKWVKEFLEGFYNFLKKRLDTEPLKNVKAIEGYLNKKGEENFEKLINEYKESYFSITDLFDYLISKIRIK